jgi:hypothetical protein
MKVELSIKDDSELRGMIKDMIRGAVKNVIRESTKAIMKETIKKQVDLVLPREIHGIVKDYIQSKNSINISTSVQKSIDSMIGKEIEDRIFWKAHEMMNRDIKGIETIVDNKLRKVKLSI